VGSDGATGTAFREALGKAQDDIESQKADYRDGVRWSFRILGAATSVALLGLELAYLNQHPQHLLFFVLALVLVSVSSGLMVIALSSRAAYRRNQVAAGLVPGELVDSDLAHTSKLLEDQEWALQGRPDYVLATDHGPVPVEVKSSKAPDQPHQSHRLQLACYLRLLEANGRAPNYGMIQYRDGLFRVNWDNKLRTDLRVILERMSAGETDRDHHHVARCIGCARRDACDQRLG
jgi:CRISPR/Cas system-associated exonuclease Cas4 (RecB family)